MKMVSCTSATRARIRLEARGEEMEKWKTPIVVYNICRDASQDFISSFTFTVPNSNIFFTQRYSAGGLTRPSFKHLLSGLVWYYPLSRLSIVQSKTSTNGWCRPRKGSGTGPPSAPFLWPRRNFCCFLSGCTFDFVLKHIYWYLIIIFPTFDGDRRDWLIRFRKYSYTVCGFQLANPIQWTPFDKVIH